jgi:hypothetical protein
MTYVLELGSGNDTVAAGTDIAHRHDFGTIEVGDRKKSERVAWDRPRVDTSVTTGQMVRGSLLGLDLALASRGLRRLATNRVPEVPRMNTNDRDAFIETHALLNPRLLRDEELHLLQQSIVRGRQRVHDAGTDEQRLDALAAESAMDARRRQLLAWIARNDATHLDHLFSLDDLFRLGATDADALRVAAWGMSSESIDGCYCLAPPRRGVMELFTGRHGTGQRSSVTIDLNLRVAELFGQLKVPAALFPRVMSMATQDFVDGTPLRYDDDWGAVLAWAADLTADRVSDYVSAVLATSGPARTQ